jgi:hypothetical protein
MLPSVAGPGTIPPPPGVSARVYQGAQPSTGETSAASTRALNANRVDPPRVLPAAFALPEDDRRRPPPDPDGPAGPPPAFKATPLERERERLAAGVDLIAPPTETSDPEPARAARLPEDPEAKADAGDGSEQSVAPADPDVRAIERLETDVAEVRRMAEPEPRRSLDVVR